MTDNTDLQPGEAPGTGRPIQQLMVDVMNDVLQIGKTSRNTSQGFDFRGIDDVINVVGPLLRRHRIVVTPHEIKDLQKERYETRSGAAMVNVTVVVLWHFTGPNGDVITAQSVGEAADAGDKAVAKAQSVAYRIVLENSFSIPTKGQTDPDSESHERVTTPRPKPSSRDWDSEVTLARTSEHLRQLYRECRLQGEMTEPRHALFLLVGQQLRDTADDAPARTSDLAVTPSDRPGRRRSPNDPTPVSGEARNV